MKRKAKAVWTGDLTQGKGKIDTESGVLKQVAYKFTTRFEDEPGTNPEELIAAANAACYSMAFSLTLKEKGYEPEMVETNATCVLSKVGDGFEITKMILDVKVKAKGLDEESLDEAAEATDEECIVSNLLVKGLEIERKASLA
ncbi:OsmC family peroxiredoxin [Candidatus Poribacteria bacterium]|nr:OsmC family peroxiredoxin [Candidatus Poribacteria bacterium]